MRQCCCPCNTRGTQTLRHRHTSLSIWDYAWIWICTVRAYEIFVFFISGPPDIFMSDRRSKIVEHGDILTICLFSVCESQFYRLDTKGRHSCYWNLFLRDMTHRHTDDSTTEQPSFSPVFTVVQNSHTKIPQRYIQWWNWSEKKCSCITDRECCFLALYSGSLFVDKDHEGDSQYWGLTVGGHTGARFRKVQIILGQSGQGVQELMPAVGTSREGGLVGISG